MFWGKYLESFASQLKRKWRILNWQSSIGIPKHYYFFFFIEISNNKFDDLPYQSIKYNKVDAVCDTGGWWVGQNAEIYRKFNLFITYQ
jgi:hypothetical protein